MYFESPSDPNKTATTALRRILNYKTMASQTATEHGKAKLRILDFETRYLESQRPSQTATE